MEDLVILAKVLGFIFLGLCLVKLLVTASFYYDRHNGVEWERPNFWIFRPLGKVKYYYDNYL